MPFPEQSSIQMGIGLVDPGTSPTKAALRNECQQQMREALRRFVVDDLRPDDGVVVLRPLDSLLDIEFSVNRSEALAAIAAFAPRRGDFAPRSEFERNFIAEAPARAEATRGRIVTAAMHALTTHLGRFDDARKTRIVVSDGFVNDGLRRGELVTPSLRSVPAGSVANQAIAASGSRTTQRVAIRRG